MASAEGRAAPQGCHVVGDGAEAEGKAELIDVEVVWSPAPRRVLTRVLQVPAGCRVDEAVRRSGLLDGLAPDVVAGLSVSVWGRLQGGGHALRARDRVELCRPLIVDPKEARRLRYRGQRAARAAKAPAEGA